MAAKRSYTDPVHARYSREARHERVFARSACWGLIAVWLTCPAWAAGPQSPLASSIGGGPAQGQTSTDSSPRADQSQIGAPTAGVPKLAEVVVTAERRKENVQDVPISIQVVTSTQLSNQNINSLYDLARKVPSVFVGDGGGRTTNLFIRGVGSGQNQSFDQSVGVFIDDMYYGRSRMTAATFLDLDRVEILKGPQSTFFGNNAIGGAFNIITRKPGNRFDASARALYGQYGQYALEGAAGGPITDTFGARVAVISDGQEGWIRNVFLNRHVPTENSLAGRLTLAFSPTENLNAYLKVEGSKYRNIGGLYLQWNRCPPAAPYTAQGFCTLALADGTPTNPSKNLTGSSPGEYENLDEGSYELTVQYKKWGDTFTSVSGYYDYHYNLNFDLDFTPPNLLNAQTPEHYYQFSQELRVVSPAERRVSYVAGLYFQTDKLALRQDEGFFVLGPDCIVGIACIPKLKPFAALVPYLPLGQDINFAQPEHNYAAFGSLTWRVTHRLSATAGLRHSWVYKNYSDAFTFGTAAQPYGDIIPMPVALQPLASALGLGAAYSTSGSRMDEAWEPSGKLQYRLAEGIMGYLSYARGFKAGGFDGEDNTGVSANIPFKPEYVNAYEIGLKSEWLNRTLVVNVDAFRSDYTDLQVSQNQFTPTGGILGIVRNAASARTQGVELETEWAATEALTLSGNVTYDRAHYIRFPDASLTQGQTLALNQCTAAHPPTPPSKVSPVCQPLEVQDLSGRPTSFAPLWSGNVTGEYSTPLSDNISGHVELTGLFSSGYFTNDGKDDPLDYQESYFRLDGRIGVAAPDGRWALDVIGTNLTDRRIITFANNPPFSLGSSVLQFQRPRSIAVQVRYHW